jgi:hypothetical protein
VPGNSLALAQLADLKARLFEKLKLLQWDNPYKVAEPTERTKFEIREPVTT